MNISKLEQRVLHVLAQGGAIHHDRGATAKITSVLCRTRDGHILTDLTLDVFRRLRRRGFLTSRSGGPYRISRKGRLAVRAQVDNR